MADETQAIVAAAKPADRRDEITAGVRGVVLSSLDQMWRFAKLVAASGLAPKGLERPEAIVIALQLGAEIGLSPMAALQSVAVINGRPSVYGDAALAVARASGLFDEAAFEETVEVTASGEIHATCTVRRLPNGKPIVRTWTLGQAKRAGLLAKAGPWQQYPERMCQMRARSTALRDGFADLLRGFPIREEHGADVREALEREALPTVHVEQLPAAASPLVAAIADAQNGKPAAARKRGRPRKEEPAAPAPPVRDETLVRWADESAAEEAAPEPPATREPGEDDEPFDFGEPGEEG